MKLDELIKYDISKMYQVYDDWPNIAEKSYNNPKNKALNCSHVNHFVFCGMGGSGTIGDFFSSILSNTDVYVSVVKGYLLPKTIDSDTLVIITSVSGNTEETIHVLQSAIKTNCKIVVFSDGGKIQEICQENNINHYKLPKIHSPRASFISYLYSILKIFENLIPINNEDVHQSISQLHETCKSISSSNLTETNQSLQLARWIDGIPIIYYPFGLQSSAIRFKNSIQENAKLHAITEDVIEACHNGIVSWETKSQVKPILVAGEDDYVKTKERWDILKKYFDENMIDYFQIHSVKGNILTKLIDLIYRLDYASIYMAILFEVDPTPVHSIDYIKREQKLKN